MHDTSFRSLDLFSPTYAIARGKFLNAASARGLAVDSHVLGLPSAEGETLAIDVVLDGPADASKMLIVLSGVHVPLVPQVWLQHWPFDVQPRPSEGS